MTVLNWTAGFQLRTGWRLLSADESARLSQALRGRGAPRPLVIARHAESGGLACLESRGRDPLQARVLVFAATGRLAEAHESLVAWIGTLGLSAGPKRPFKHGG